MFLKIRKYIKIAKKNNLYFETIEINTNYCDRIFPNHCFIASGSEGFIYKFENKCLKIYYSLDSKYRIYDIEKHNKHFSNKLNIIGIIKVNKTYLPIVESDFILGEEPSLEELNVFKKKNNIENFKFKTYILGELQTFNCIKDTQGNIFLLDETYMSKSFYILLKLKCFLRKITKY
jgi:hypothetical protein